MREVCRQAYARFDASVGQRALTVAINLSAGEFADAGPADTVVEALHAARLPAHLLRLEIIDAAAMGDAAATRDVLRLLRALGIHLAPDDFGTGYSSLDYSRQFPVDTLRSTATSSAASRSIDGIWRFAALVMLSLTLRLDVVAEGIETEEQVKLARDFNCVRAQGYSFGKLMPSEEIAMAKSP